MEAIADKPTSRFRSDWESSSILGKARRLIEKHGCWRLKEDLEDAEASINKN